MEVAACDGDGDGATRGAVPPPAGGDVSTEYALLKARFKLLQAQALALADAYESACEELRDEQDRQAIMVEKLAEIRVRRLNAFLRVPENGMMLFLEETKLQMRSRHPMVSRREIQRLQRAEWECMPDDEQQVWTTRLRALALKNRKKDGSNGKKIPAGASARKASRPAPVAIVATVASPTATSSSLVRTPKPSVVPAKRKTPSITGSTKDSVEEKAKKKPKLQLSAKGASATEKSDALLKTRTANAAVKNKPQPPAMSKTATGESEAPTPRPKATPRPKMSKIESAAEDGAAFADTDPPALKTPTKRPKKKALVEDEQKAGSPSKPALTPRKSPAKPKKAATPKEKKTPRSKKVQTPKKKESPKAPAKSRSKINKVFMKANISDDDDDNDDDTADDDDDDDDDDAGEDVVRKGGRRGKKQGRPSRDDDSQSSGAGSGSEEDDDEHMAQLPTGAFG